MINELFEMLLIFDYTYCSNFFLMDRGDTEPTFGLGTINASFVLSLSSSDSLAILDGSNTDLKKKTIFIDS